MKKQVLRSSTCFFTLRYLRYLLFKILSTYLIMKAVFLTNIREMEIRDIPEPDLKNSTDVLIKVGTVGVCGSDVH